MLGTNDECNLVGETGRAKPNVTSFYFRFQLMSA